MKSDCLIVHREEKTREELARLVRSQKKKKGAVMERKGKRRKDRGKNKRKGGGRGKDRGRRGSASSLRT